jgi:peroxiredoxin
LRLLTRAVFVVDQTGILGSAELVKELTGAVLQVVKKLAE